MDPISAIALFLAGAVWAFISPDDAFWSLASVLGLLLVLKGTLDIIMATESRGYSPIWGVERTARPAEYPAAVRE